VPSLSAGPSCTPTTPHAGDQSCSPPRSPSLLSAIKRYCCSLAEPIANGSSRPHCARLGLVAKVLSVALLTGCGSDPPTKPVAPTRSYGYTIGLPPDRMNNLIYVTQGAAPLPDTTSTQGNVVSADNIP
jgi:hypothetical protein